MHLNHTIVHARDKEASAKFLSEVLGLSPPPHAGPTQSPHPLFESAAGSPPGPR